MKCLDGRDAAFETQAVKLVAVGDPEAEKTRLLCATSKSSSNEHSLRFSTSCSPEMIRGEPVDVKLFYTTGQDEYDHLRPLTYPQTDVFLVCFSVVSPSSYQRVREKWVPEITHHCPDAPFLLVGTRTDLRGDRGVLDKLAEDEQRPLQPEDGEKLARELRAVKYMECSAETKEGVEEVFDEAVLAALDDKETKKKKKKCVLL